MSTLIYVNIYTRQIIPCPIRLHVDVEPIRYYIPECPDPYYGQDCKYQCTCGDRQSCHPVTGKCICPAGFIGGDCLTGICIVW